MAKDLGFELVDVEYVKEGSDFYLRVYIDKEGGITVDDCETFSRRLDGPLDAEDFIDGPYILEVSSPGLTRPLKKDRDFERSIGKLVEVKLFKAFDGQKEFESELEAFDDKTISLKTENGTIRLERQNISSIRLAFTD
ncbi:MAG: ribosome maturation factor RimP [Lachnospiraceae bacterium]|nr:ribosome maturation factor RimP [Lachnospiraceae bacterium]